MIVERAKKCLDFTTTLYIIHLGVCSFYDGIPQNWEWWVLQMASLALMVVLGETHVCRQRRGFGLGVLELNFASCPEKCISCPFLRLVTKDIAYVRIGVWTPAASPLYRLKHKKM